jgi:hypothetical protein
MEETEATEGTATGATGDISHHSEDSLENQKQTENVDHTEDDATAHGWFHFDSRRSVTSHFGTLGPEWQYHCHM